MKIRLDTSCRVSALRLTLLAVGIGALFYPLKLPAQASQAGLVMRCENISAPLQAAACTGARAWVRPQSGDYILTFTSAPAVSTSVAWSDPNLQFRPWPVPASDGVQVCTKALTAAQTAIPAGGLDNCAPGADPVLKIFILPAAVTLTTQPTVLTWNAPTQNVDGSALTDLGGFDLWCADTDAALTALPDTVHGGKPCASTAAGVTTYIFSNLPPGLHWFAVSAWACRSPCQVSPRSAHVSVSISPPVILPPPPSSPPGAPSNVSVSTTVTAPSH